MSAGPVSSSNLFAPFLDRLAEAASGAIMPHFRQGFAIDNKWKAGFDPVTIADKNGETAMRALINETYPDHGILGEEHGPENLDAEHVWVLDPIDGTRAFITGLPTWGTLIGLRTNGVPSLGMMVQPYIGERFGGDGKTAWYDGPLGARQLKTRPCEKLEDATIFTTTPALFKNGERQAFDQIEAAVQLSRYGLRTNGVPSLGMMVQPYIGERFGGDGKTAWYDGPLGARQLKTRPCEKLEDATIFTTTPALFKNGERQAFDQIEAAVQLSRYGTDCYAYCMVAAGHGDAVIESGLQAYDIVALVPIIEGAGGVVTTWTGGSPADGGQIVASGDPRLHEILLRDLAKAA